MLAIRRSFVQEPETKPETVPASDGHVMVNVGQGYGALVISASPDRNGLEVEIHPADDLLARTHVWIRPRSLGASTIYAGVFPSLKAGLYAILTPDGSIGSTVEIQDGITTEQKWL